MENIWIIIITPGLCAAEMIWDSELPSQPSFHYSVTWKHLQFQLLGGGHRSKSWDLWSVFPLADGIPERDLKILTVKLHQRIHKIIVGEIERNNIYIYLFAVYILFILQKGKFQSVLVILCSFVFSLKRGEMIQFDEYFVRDSCMSVGVPDLSTVEWK